jgi:HEAT repeats
VGRTDEHRAALRALPPGAWEGYLAEHSGLPGPRGNLELAAAVAEEAPAPVLRRYASSPDEYLAACGAFGLGRLLAEGDETAEGELRALAQDSRWRVREGVAMGLQRLGDADPERLEELARAWAGDDALTVLRAAVAGLCEPRLLSHRSTASAALDVLDQVTAHLAAVPGDRRRGNESFRVLRQGLGYCWSVAVAAAPDEGFARLDRWAASEDRDVRWVIRENLRKARLRRAGADRWAALSDRMSGSAGRG